MLCVSVDFLDVNYLHMIADFILCVACSQSSCGTHFMAVIPWINCCPHWRIVVTWPIGFVIRLGEFFESWSTMSSVRFIFFRNYIVLLPTLVKFERLANLFTKFSSRWKRCSHLLNWIIEWTIIDCFCWILSIFDKNMFRPESQFLWGTVRCFGWTEG